MLAIGGARGAARLAWAAVDRVTILVFALQGLVAGLVAGRAASSSPPSFWTACAGKRAAGRGPHPFET